MPRIVGTVTSPASAQELREQLGAAFGQPEKPVAITIREADTDIPNRPAVYHDLVLMAGRIVMHADEDTYWSVATTDDGGKIRIESESVDLPVYATIYYPEMPLESGTVDQVVA